MLGVDIHRFTLLALSRPRPYVTPNLSGIIDQVRYATKKGGGVTSNHGSSPGQRLGLKLFSDQYAEPGNIIIRQRGTQFHPGQHVYMGRDHTLHAAIPGFIRFYRLGKGRKERRYVGIVRERGEKLPRDEATRGRSRYFGYVDLTGHEQTISGESADEAAR